MRLIATMFLLLWLAGCGNFNHTTRYVIVESPILAKHLVENPPDGAEVLVMRYAVVPKKRHVVSKSTKVPTHKTPTVVKKVASTAGAVVCPPMVFGALPPTPGVPTDDLKRISPLDRAAVNKLTIKHIDDLRQHIAVLRTKIRNSEQQYRHDCRQLPAK